ncbi:MAG: sarcosine oxidase subunit alpha family protein [Bdellovibrio sp.]|nr:sarcosine oxidase subunit alpha family protein [Methylotenera sp.]
MSRINKPRIKHKHSRVNLSKPLNFTFDGKPYIGYQGDTLASALLANGIKVMARSFKYGRPRGIVGSWAEEPNCLVQIDMGAKTTPDLKATQVELYEGLVAGRTSGWPSLAFDLKSIGGHFSRFMPAGFYYKTFKWPAKFWPLYEHVIRKAAGYGASPIEADVETYDHKHHHTDVLVVGGGAAGLLAAQLSGQCGASVILLDDQSEMGGYLLSTPNTTIGGKNALEWRDSVITELQSLPNVQILTRTTAFGLHDMNMIQAVELLQDHLPHHQRNAIQRRERLHRIRANKVVLATGAFERPLVFGNNDVPGVMTVSALATYFNRYGVACGKHTLILTSNDSAYQAVADLAAGGVKVTLADVRDNINAEWDAHFKQLGIDVFTGFGISEVLGSNSVTGARLSKLHPTNPMENFEKDLLRRRVVNVRDISCDVIASSGGLSPTVHLFCHDGGRPTWSDESLAFVVSANGRANAGIYCVGAVTGEFQLQKGLEKTVQTTQEMLASLGKSATNTMALNTNEIAPNPTKAIFHIATSKKAFVDFQNDVAVTDIQLAVRENFKSIEHIKRYTALGFGTDQGKLSNVNGFAIAAEALGKTIPEVGTTTYRPAYTPVSFGALAGAHVAETFEPRRYTAMQASHEQFGAEYETVGNWMRPWYFPQNGEDMQAAVNRECLAARNGVAIMDASTLGKIDIQGKDVREFLNRVYSNSWSQLASGKCRYGLMLNEAGMVMDDGVTACITDTHFLMTTTTGGAANVLNWLEKWHQTEWTELEVYMTSVTDHWATASLVGPKSREVLAKLCSDIDLNKDAFKFMEWRDGTVAGVPARVFRISFSGELAYEINVDASYGNYVWQALMAAGKAFDITPYGTETMHVLRAEKGFIIVGQETDGSVTPLDLDMAWAVSLKKPFSFIGKRSLARSDTVRTDRKQLVGLLTEDPTIVLKEGAQIINSSNISPPVAMFGHVTSSYYSAFLGRSIALALVTDGFKRRENVESIFAYAEGKAIKAKIVSSVFVDAEGARHHG